MAGEIERAMRRFEERKKACGLDVESAANLADEETARKMWSGLDLSIDEVIDLQPVIGTTAIVAARAGVPLAYLAPGMFFDGVTVGLLIAEARERERREPNVEELNMIALALKNQGIEQVAPERGVEILIERLSAAVR